MYSFCCIILSARHSHCAKDFQCLKVAVYGTCTWPLALCSVCLPCSDYHDCSAVVCVLLCSGIIATAEEPERLSRLSVACVHPWLQIFDMTLWVTLSKVSWITWSECAPPPRSHRGSEGEELLTYSEKAGLYLWKGCNGRSMWRSSPIPRANPHSPHWTHHQYLSFSVE